MDNEEKNSGKMLFFFYLIYDLRNVCTSGFIIRNDPCYSIWGNPEKVCSFLTEKTSIFISKKFLRPFWKIYIFFMRVFLFFHPFFPSIYSAQPDFGANKRAFRHFTPHIVVLFESSLAPGLILIRTWRQNTTIWWQELHIPKYSNY